MNRLERLLPQGLLVHASWLEEHGYSRALRSQYVSSGWLSNAVRGVYWRPLGQRQFAERPKHLERRFAVYFDAR